MLSGFIYPTSEGFNLDKALIRRSEKTLEYFIKYIQFKIMMLKQRQVLTPQTVRLSYLEKVW